MESILNKALAKMSPYHINEGEVVPEVTFLLRRIFLLYNFKTWAEFAKVIGASPVKMSCWKTGRNKPGQKYLLKMMDMILAVHTKKVIEMQTKIDALQEHEVPCSYCPVRDLILNVSTT